MKLKNLLYIFLLLCSITLSAQENGYFLVELEPRSPDVEAMVQAFEGTKAISMLANNIDGEEVAISNYKGKVVLLWFWNQKCDRCIQEIPTLNQISKEFENLEILSFADEPSADVRAFRESHPIDFNVVGSSRMLAEGPYSGELGYPKMFIVDKDGIIKWVFPSKDFLSEKFDLYNIIKTLYLQLNQ